MVQPALRSIKESEETKPMSLAERLDAEFPVGARFAAARPEPTVSSMAERFAPGTLRATRTAPPAPPPTLTADASLTRPAPQAGLFSSPTRGVIAVLMAVAIAPAGILAGLLWFGAIRTPEAGSEVRISSPVQQAAVVPTIPVRTKVPDVALTAPEEILAKAGDTIDFTIGIEAEEELPARSAIAIRDLPEGISFSSGRPFGEGEWNLRPDEIANLTLRLPEEQIGVSDLRVELVAADGAVLARTATRLDVAPPPTAGLAVRSGEEDRIADLMDHGQKMIDVGYFAGARAYYERAAEAGSGEAALAVGATYDPDFVAALGVQGIKPDSEAAGTWYARAAALGVTDREGKLAVLKQAWTGGEPHAVDAAMPPEDAAPAPMEQPNAAMEEKPGPLGRLVAAATELATSEEWVEVSSAVNVRKGPSSNDETFKVAAQGTKLRVVGREGNWVHIADPKTAQQGWIYARFLKEAAAP